MLGFRLLTKFLADFLRSLKTKKSELAFWLFLICTRDGTWTHTAITDHWILSPACLPIPPLEQPTAKYSNWYRIERKTGFEPATLTLARWCSTPELLSRSLSVKRTWHLTVLNARANLIYFYQSQSLFWNFYTDVS